MLVHQNYSCGVVVWEVVTLMHFSPPLKTYGDWERFAKHSVLTIPLATIIGCGDQNYMQIPIRLTVAEYSHLCIQL